MRKFGLIGYPLGHSFSKIYFNEKFDSEHITGCSYELYPLKSIDLLPSLLKEEKFLCGLNVTIPYKSAVIGFLNFISDEAAEVGAVNVVKIRSDSGGLFLSGFNSDVTGFRDSLVPLLKVKKGNAIVLGTGGSSKAVRHVLKKIGMHITSVSRKAGEGVITYEDMDSDLIRESKLIVNTTPLGMFPDVESRPPINYDALSKDHILYDLVYNPEMTSFLLEGEKRGCMVISGLKMLHLQAEKSWEIWNDERY